jgi:hypothetical protein
MIQLCKVRSQIRAVPSQLPEIKWVLPLAFVHENEITPLVWPKSVCTRSAFWSNIRILESLHPDIMHPYYKEAKLPKLKQRIKI